MVTTRYSISCDEGRTIHTTVTDMASVVGEWLASINSGRQEQYASSEDDYSMYSSSDDGSPRRREVVGLDVEWRPNFSGHRAENNPVATLQLCVNESCLIIQLCYLNHIPRSLRNFLTNPNFVFVGVRVEDDASKLWNDYGLECNQTCDVRSIAVEEYPFKFSSNQPGLKELFQKLVGFRLEKPSHVSVSDWERRVLTYEQVEYACLDAYASCRIGETLQNHGIALV